MNLTDEQIDLLRAMVEVHRSGNTAPFSLISTLSDGNFLVYPGLKVPVQADDTDLIQLQKLDLVTLDRDGCEASGTLTQKGIAAIVVGSDDAPGERSTAVEALSNWSRYRASWENKESVDRAVAVAKQIAEEPRHRSHDRTEARCATVEAARSRFDDLAEVEYGKWIASGHSVKSIVEALRAIQTRVSDEVEAISTAKSGLLSPWYRTDCKDAVDEELTRQLANWVHEAKTEQIIVGHVRASREPRLPNVIPNLKEVADRERNEARFGVSDARLRAHVSFAHGDLVRRRPTFELTGGLDAGSREQVLDALSDLGMWLGASDGMIPVELCVSFLFDELRCERDRKTPGIDEYLFPGELTGGIVTSLVEAAIWYWMRLNQRLKNALAGLQHPGAEVAQARKRPTDSRGQEAAMNLTDEQYELLKAMVEVYRSGNTASFIFATTLADGNSLVYPGLDVPVKADETDLNQLEKLDLVTLDRNHRDLLGKVRRKGIDAIRGTADASARLPIRGRVEEEGEPPYVSQPFPARDSAGTGQDAGAADDMSEKAAAPLESRPQAVLDEEGWYTHVRLAEYHSVDKEALRKRLERFRDKTIDGWKSPEDRGVREPKYLYQLRTISAIIKDLKASTGRRASSAERPAK